MTKSSKYVPIDPDKLTPEQRKIWDAYGFDIPEPNTTREFTDAQFRYVLSLEGIPLDK